MGTTLTYTFIMLFILTTTHFIEEEKEMQKGCVTSSRSHSWQMMQMGVKLKPASPEDLLLPSQ